VSQGWQQLCGYSRDEVLGRPLSMMQGPRTEQNALAALMRAVHARMPVSVRLTNYTKARVPFVHQLSCEPLRDPTGDTKCFQATSLVLQSPGEAQCEVDPVGGAMPPICTNAVPPLWPLLGRAMQASHTAASCFGAPSAKPPPGRSAPPTTEERLAAASRTASAIEAPPASFPALDKFDDDFLDWLESSGRDSTDLTSTYINRIDAEMVDAAE